MKNRPFKRIESSLLSAAVELTTRCHTCNNPASAPYRAYDNRGKVVEGCVDKFHTGRLVTPSESSFWHTRKAAFKIRKELQMGVRS